MSQPYIDQLFKGKVKQLGDPNAEKRINRQWETGMFKKPTEEKIWLSETGLIGDEVADKKNHGGPEKSALCLSDKALRLLAKRNRAYNNGSWRHG